METILHIDTFYTDFTHRRFWTQTPLNTFFSLRNLYTKQPLQTDAFTRRGLYTDQLLHTRTAIFLQTSLYTEQFLHIVFSLHLCVGFLWVLVFGCALPAVVRPVRRLPSPSVSHTTLSHNWLTHNSLTHSYLTRNLLTHTNPTLSLTLSRSSLTHNILTTLTHNTHAQPSHAQLFTHNSLTHNLLTHNNSLSDMRGDLVWRAWHLVTRSAVFRVAGVALGMRGTWHAWHLWRWAGSGDALGRGWSVVTLRSFAWQVWHLVPSTVTWYGRRGTWWDRPSLLVWQALHYNNGLALVTRLVAPGPPWCRGLLSGRCGTWWHRPSLCVACVALMALGWLWWRAWSRLVRRDARSFARQAWHLVASISTFTLHGRLGTYNNGLALVTRSVAWSAVTPKPFAWQAWHLVTSTVTLYSRRGTWWHLTFRLCGRHGAYHTDLALTRLVAVGPSCGRRGTWWHRPLHLVTSTLTLCGRRGTYGVGMALWRRNLLRGRRGTWLHPRSLCVASVALLAVGWLWYWPVSSHLPQSCLKHDRTEQVWAG